MNIAFIAAHTIKPAFVAGQVYEGTIVEMDEKESGVTMRLDFEDLSGPAFWHFNLLSESEDAKRISMDEFKGVTDQIGGELNDSADLIGKKLKVRLLTQTDSALPKCALPVVSKRANSLAV
jgi:hypothetical protein